MLNTLVHRPIAIANFFIHKSDYSLTLMQLLKLSYIAHGFRLGLSKKPLSKELAQAWKYGPVFPEIYHEFKWQPTRKIKKLGTGEYNEDTPIQSNFDNEEKKILYAVYDIYGALTGVQLSVLTHKKGTPWYKSYYEGETPGKDFYGVPIPNKEIQEHYSRYFSELQK